MAIPILVKIAMKRQMKKMAENGAKRKQEGKKKDEASIAKIMDTAMNAKANLKEKKDEYVNDFKDSMGLGNIPSSTELKNNAMDGAFKSMGMEGMEDMDKDFDNYKQEAISSLFSS